MVTGHSERRDAAPDLCAECGEPSTSTIVTFTGWVHDLCEECARPVVDHCSVRRLTNSGGTA